MSKPITFWVKTNEEIFSEKKVKMKTIWAENQADPFELYVDPDTGQEVGSWELEQMEGNIYPGTIEGSYVLFLDDYKEKKKLSKNFVHYI